MTNKISKDGYYLTRSGEAVHRLVWQDAYGNIPEGYVIHHLNEDPKCNQPDNLVALTNTEHLRLHNSYKTPYYRVTRERTECRPQGYILRYSYPENGFMRSIIRDSLSDLREAVLERQLEWRNNHE